MGGAGPRPSPASQHNNTSPHNSTTTTSQPFNHNTTTHNNTTYNSTNTAPSSSESRSQDIDSGELDAALRRLGCWSLPATCALDIREPNYTLPQPASGPHKAACSSPCGSATIG